MSQKKGRGFDWREDWPAPGELFYKSPHRLFASGLAVVMGNSEFKRYSTLLWIANTLNTNQFQIDVEDLARIDGVSPRRARDVHIKLEERGLILIEKMTKPYTYVILLLSEWEHGGSETVLTKIGKCLTVQTRRI